MGRNPSINGSRGIDRYFAGNTAIVLFPTIDRFYEGAQLQCGRITKAEKQVIDRILGPQPGEIPAEIRIYIRVNKRFRARHVARLRKAHVAAKFYIGLDESRGRASVATTAWQSPNAQSMRADPD